VNGKSRRLPKSSGVFKKRDLIEASAYWRLTGTDIRVYEIFRLKCRVVGTKEARKMHVQSGTIKNNGDLVFTYAEAEGYGLCSATFKRSLDHLIELGFLDVYVPGNLYRSTKYGISDRWKDYGTKDFKKKLRKKQYDHRTGLQKVNLPTVKNDCGQIVDKINNNIIITLFDKFYSITVKNDCVL
jgi:hypothetical protein